MSRTVHFGDGGNRFTYGSSDIEFSTVDKWTVGAGFNSSFGC